MTSGRNGDEDGRHAVMINNSQVGVLVVGDNGRIDLEGGIHFHGAPRTEGDLPNDPKKIQELVDALVDCPCMKTTASRDMVVNRLPDLIRNRIARHDSPLLDAESIFTTCLNYEHGLRALIEAVEASDRGTKAFIAFQRKIEPGGACSPPSGDLNLDESRFISSLFEKFHQYNVILIVGQQHREQASSRELLRRFTRERYGESSVMHLTPLRGEELAPERYFGELGRQCGAEMDVRDSTGLIQCIDAKMAGRDRLFVLVNGFEGGPRKAMEGLAGAFRNLTERHGRALHILICGGEKLAELSIFGALSMLTSAEMVEWPELTVSDIRALCADRPLAASSSIDEAAARRILEITGGHPRLVRECIGFCGADGGFDEAGCRERYRIPYISSGVFCRSSRNRCWRKKCGPCWARWIWGRMGRSFKMRYCGACIG